MSWIGWAMLSAAFAALTAVISKAGLRHVDPDAALMARTAVVLAATSLWAGATGRLGAVARLPAANWIPLALAGLATALSWLCYFRALAIGEAGRVAVIDKLSVPLVAFIAAVALGERLGPRGWLGVVLAAVGAILVSTER